MALCRPRPKRVPRLSYPQIMQMDADFQGWESQGFAGFSMFLHDFLCFFLGISFFWHYVSAVVQKSSSPTHPGGKPPLVWYARVSGGEGTGNMVEDVDESRTHSVHCTPHGSPDFTTGTVALLFKPRAVSSARAATHIKFPCVLCVPWLENPFWTPSM